MAKPSSPVKLTVKVAAELAAASAIMLGAGAFANAAPTTSTQGDTTTAAAGSYYYSSGYYYYKY